MDHPAHILVMVIWTKLCTSAQIFLLDGCFDLNLFLLGVVHEGAFRLLGNLLLEKQIMPYTFKLRNATSGKIL